MHSILVTLLAIGLTGTLAQTTPSCTDCAPNPIASVYPGQITGTQNTTIGVIPIPYHVARSIIPAKYGILTAAYEHLLAGTGFPANSYPLIVRAGCDHDIQVLLQGTGIINVPDFQNVHFDYPFVDLLNDGYSSFKYGHYFPVTASNANAISGNAAYGGVPVPAMFVPSYRAYNATSTPSTYARSTENADGAPPSGKTNITFSAFTADTNQRIMTSQYNSRWPQTVGPYPLKFYANVTNQPQFYNGSSCDLQVQLFNTSLSTGVNELININGNVSIDAPYYPVSTTFTNVYGIAIDIAFIETNYVPCASLKGYSFSETSRKRWVEDVPKTHGKRDEEKVPKMHGKRDEDVPKTHGKRDEDVPKTHGKRDEKVPKTHGKRDEDVPKTHGKRDEDVPKTHGKRDKDVLKTHGKRDEDVLKTHGRRDEDVPKTHGKRDEGVPKTHGKRDEDVPKTHGRDEEKVPKTHGKRDEKKKPK